MIEKILVGRPRKRWKTNIKTSLSEIWYNDVEQINLAQGGR
jgi:hypothetical protein